MSARSSPTAPVTYQTRTRIRRGWIHIRPAVESVLLTAALCGVGVGIASGHMVLSVAAVAVPVALLGLGRGVEALDRISPATRATALMWLALAASALVWRQRSTTQLTENPLDRAALVRVVLVVAAGVVALVFLLDAFPTSIPLSMRFFGLYAVVAFVAAVASPKPFFAGYRALELAVGLTVVLAVLVRSKEQAGHLMMALAVGTLGALVAVAWIEAALVPSQAWESSGGGLVSKSLNGVLPSVSSNSLGFYGGLLALWGLAQMGGNRPRQWLFRLAFSVGLLTLLAAQYRTGIIGFMIAASMLLWLRRRWGLMLVSAGGAIALTIFVGWGESITQAERILARGHPELLHNLDSRTLYWNAAKPFILDRPFFGWGLNVKSRDVLVSLGLQDTSTLHGTWPEVLLGTGIVGATLLALTFATALWAAWRVRATALGAAAFAMLLLFVLRSATGSSLELFDVIFLVFAASAVLAAQLGDEPSVEEP